jgi:hypothetical protein
LSWATLAFPSSLKIRASNSGGVMMVNFSNVDH